MAASEVSLRVEWIGWMCALALGLGACGKDDGDSGSGMETDATGTGTGATGSGTGATGSGTGATGSGTGSTGSGTGATGSGTGATGSGTGATGTGTGTVPTETGWTDTGDLRSTETAIATGTGTGMVSDTSLATDTGLVLTDTGTPPAPEVVAASCTRLAHPLLAECSITLDMAGRASVTLTPSVGPQRTFRSDGAAVTHQILAWGLRASTAYTWSAGTFTGQVTTGALADGAEKLDTTITGSTSGFDAIVYPTGCGGDRFAVMAEPSGEIIWYQRLPAGVTPVGFTWSQADKRLSMVTSSRREYLELDLRGDEPLRLTEGVHFDGPIHHDAVRHDGLIYVLSAEEVVGSDLLHYVMDRVLVFDGTTLLGTARLADSYDPALIPNGPPDAYWRGNFPDAEDWSHGNNITFDQDDHMVVSLRWLDSAVALGSDPRAADFGKVKWVAVGSDVSLPDADYVPVAGAEEGWEGQHHVSRIDNRLYLFDNRAVGNDARALQLTLNGVAGTHRIAENWDLGVQCRYRGAAQPLDDGGVIATCAPLSEFFRFSRGKTTYDWRFAPACISGFRSVESIRAIPVRIE